MTGFSAQDLKLVEQQWRALGPDHEWVGWAAVGTSPHEIWLFRKRSNWRHLPLRRATDGYVLSDERNTHSVRLASLEGIAGALASIPTLATATSDPEGGALDQATQASHTAEETRVLTPRWNADGLIAAIAQDVRTSEVLMLAWMNETALRATLETGRAVYWSRSRQALWAKGDTSGHYQRVVEVRIDCDQDAVLLKVEQTGAACHTGRRSCFYRVASAVPGTDPVLAYRD